ncbi:unnamed protein product [Danaus chrysippus]|uniref:(African queen) hypothetical protein n=1 Tax=Danaus chrysippus TaxID=151541 RepID=A0A8J2VYY1_9NEOP|nr:unnamed protein product [Danaus chrysippus]
MYVAIVLCSRQFEVMGSLSPLDPSSFSRPEQAIIKHVDLSYDVDFDKKVLNGVAVLTIEVLDYIENVILDTSELDIKSIELKDGSALQFVLGDPVPNYGSKLTIDLPQSAAPEQQLQIKIKFNTSPNATALQWLDANQTSGKKHPYLFSQCQPIHARSILPCQDTPAVKFTYEAEITAPEPFTVLMSAIRLNANANKTSFSQPVPIPSYLLALAIGVLESRKLGPSWTGNLVTNRNFEHFWLNEGFTVFLERKVAASLIPDPEESRKSRDFHSLLGLQELSETINSNLGAENPLTRLVPDLDQTHPDDSFSRVPYEKGSLFLRYLEDLVGGAAVFDEFMRSYLNHFQSKSLDTDQFKAYLLNYFKGNEKLGQVDWDSWLYKSGMPPVIPEYDTSMTKSVNDLLAKINSSNTTFSYEDIKSFTPHQIINLLQSLIDQEPLPVEKLRYLGKEYKINDSKNTEIIYRWLRLCIRSKDQDKVDDALAFVNHQGRMKYVRPIYRDLYAWEDVREQAIKNFLENEPSMMHVSAYTLRKDLHLSE